MEPEDTSLLDVLVDCFERNEVLEGWFMRQLPLPSSAAAQLKYDAYRAELIRWKGAPRDQDVGTDWQRADWGDLRMKRGGRGIMIWVKRAGVEDWWHRTETWAGDPLAQAREW